MENNSDLDPWTFTDTITVYNWESHPDWDKANLDINDPFESIKIGHRNGFYFMIEAKRILCNYKCLGWDDVNIRNYFIPSKDWEKNKFYPIELSNNTKNLYRSDFPYKQPILTHSVDIPLHISHVHVHGVWKIYYSGGSDTGSMYVNSIDNFKKDANKCNKSFQMMYFPGVYINNPMFCMKKDENKPFGIIYDNVSKCKVSIE